MIDNKIENKIDNKIKDNSINESITNANKKAGDIVHEALNRSGIPGDSFSYTYSATQQDEIEEIRRKYLPPEEDKMEQLRKLDQSVYTKATMVSIIVGVIGSLIMGFGMSLAMTDLGSSLGMSGNVGFIVGIIIGVIGMGILGFAYPLYNKTLKTERQKIAPEIIRLTDELRK